MFDWGGGGRRYVALVDKWIDVLLYGWLGGWIVEWGRWCQWMDVWIDEGKEGRKFNDTLNTFYLRLYGIGYLLKDHSDNPLHGLLFLISSKGSFMCIIPQSGVGFFNYHN